MRVEIAWEPPDALTVEEKREWEAIASAAVSEGPGSNFKARFVLAGDEWDLPDFSWGRAMPGSFEYRRNDELAPIRAAVLAALAEHGKAVRRESAIRIDWQPSKPEGWRECEVRIRKRLLEHAERTAYKGKLL